jgi:hypothetical protein
MGVALVNGFIDHSCTVTRNHNKLQHLTIYLQTNTFSMTAYDSISNSDLYCPAKNFLLSLCTDSTENTILYCLERSSTDPLPSNGRMRHSIYVIM